MKLSNVIAFTQRMQHLIDKSDNFIDYVFTPNDDTMSLRVTVEYCEPFSNGGIVMHGHICEDVSYEEFNKTDFDAVALSDDVFLRLNRVFYDNVF